MPFERVVRLPISALEREELLGRVVHADVAGADERCDEQRPVDDDHTPPSLDQESEERLDARVHGRPIKVGSPSGEEPEVDGEDE